MSASWKKIENDHGFPYYINSINNTEQWDHPKFYEIIQRLDDCNYIKYGSYRVAGKFRVLQHALSMNDVPLSIIRGVFERHKLGSTESTLSLEAYDLEAVLSDIFFAANKQSNLNIDVDFATEIMLNFLYNIYDKQRTMNVDVLSTKLVLAILSIHDLHDLHNFLFNLCSDHNNCVTRLRLQTVLTKFFLIIKYLNEDIVYGQYLIKSSLEDCFSKNPGLVGITENTFASWMESIPQLFTWLPLLIRMRISESVIYEGKCSTCKINRIVGLRYRCLKCLRYIQCQRCFLSGRLSNSHKLTHLMKEHCKNATPHTPLKFLKYFKCNLKDNESYLSNLFDSKTLSNSPCADVLVKPSECQDIASTPLSSPLNQLQVVIRQLEMQNRELQQMLFLGSKTDKDMKRYLEEHRQHVATQIQNLKVLKDIMNNTTETPTKTTYSLTSQLVQSTPMITSNKTRPLQQTLDIFSPISQESELQLQHKQIDIPTFNIDTHSKLDEHDSFAPFSMKDISSWIGGQPTTSNNDFKTTDDFTNLPAQTDLDDALAKLQQILANNFSLDESLGNVDNCQLKNAVTEVEGMLSSIIDNAECNKMPQKESEYRIDYLTMTT